MPRAVQEDERETHRLAPATDEQGSDEEVEVEIEVEEEATVDVNVSPRPMPTEPCILFLSTSRTFLLFSWHRIGHSRRTSS